MPVCTGRVGPCAWSHIRGAFVGDDFATFLAYLSDLAEQAVPGQLVLDLAHDVPMPTPLQRRQIAKIVADAPALKQVAGHALVINSAVGRGVLTAINWIARAPFPERTFPNPSSGLAWLEKQNPTFDSAALEEQIVQTCPGFDALRW